MARTLTVIGWYIPAAFELAQHSTLWRAAQYASFLATGLLFWWPVVRPWPAARRLSGAMIPLYLFTATLPCDALSAFLVFGERTVYHRLGAGPAALADQQAAGAFMWVAITFLYLVPALVFRVRALSPEQQSDRKDVREPLVDRSMRATTNTAVDIRGSGSDPVSRAVGTFRSRQYP